MSAKSSRSSVRAPSLQGVALFPGTPMLSESKILDEKASKSPRLDIFSIASQYCCAIPLALSRYVAAPLQLRIYPTGCFSIVDNADIFRQLTIQLLILSLSQLPHWRLGDQLLGTFPYRSVFDRESLRRHCG